MNGKFKLNTYVDVKNYGKSKIIDYDPRFPKYYSIITWVKNIPITIHNISEKDILQKI